MHAIKELLGPDNAAGIDRLEALGEPEFPIELPSDLALALHDLAVPHEDIDALLALAPTTPELRWLMQRCAYSLIARMGEVEQPPAFPVLPESAGLIHRYFYVYVFVGVLPHVREFHRQRGIPDEVSRSTLRDLGRNMAVYRQRHGIGGLEVVPWLTRHFRGALYDLGRLQFERTRLGTRTGNAVRAAGLPYGPGDPSLGAHIPEFSGPLHPRACDAAFARAGEFFAQYFPEERYAVATCNSWLLDEQLAEYLPDNSNIIQFQRRFRSAYRPADADADAMLFVFGRPDAPLDQLPRETRLQRAIIDHQKAGRHWHGGTGWLEL